jgi:maltoporin
MTGRIYLAQEVFKQGGKKVVLDFKMSERQHGQNEEDAEDGRYKIKEGEEEDNE